ncbi:MAG: electron transfer flavoprotein [Candidatus Dadabacteria bacterium]|nr:electron transfer flavoprotein [Candidatus Dadabacteria bacterium]NIS07947.1 electron transfer flavoprotein [Candidatus Dadabacteria bacterium]NIV43040.1 electron transfer flavoprotein [Candidatus Dadabacteria bacterium]NIX14903.1 electron transfer flavoprotein [Candidatus Dadabacteria bacterium]NIY21531.1 electron transfer flavoprotein [Candidatus Dadabacteria bacterium]
MSNKPSDYSPPVQDNEFITTITDKPEDLIEVGVLFVGAGPASLAGAIRLGQLLENEPEIMESLGEIPIAVLEKGKYPGSHLVSGAVVNPIPIRRLFPELNDSDFPFLGEVNGESLYFMTEKMAIPLPTPPTMKNHGNFVASISQLAAWLGEKAEELGVMVFNEMAAVKLIVEDKVVKGVRTDDKGADKDGNPLENFQPGSDILAKATVLGEGTTGHLSMALFDHFEVPRENPQIYALGVKEIWEVPKPLDKVIHTMGWPLSTSSKNNEFGGSFIYPMGEDKVCIGLVVGLDYKDASLSVHDLLQQLKSHPLVKKILEGGKKSDKGWGAKTIPEGGYYAVPDRLNVPGAVVVGDSAGLVNVPALKGIHYAMMSGILAAESIFNSLKQKNDLQTYAGLDSYDAAIRDSFIMKDLYAVRNMRQAFQYGFIPGFILSGLMTVTNGKFPGGKFSGHPDGDQEMFIGQRDYPKPDNEYYFDKLTSVFDSGNRTRDNQQDHVRIEKEVSEEVGETWINMCPAQVYEWHEENGKKVIRTDPTNCIQCGAITSKGGRLTPPEGGSGPEYTQT